MDEKENRKLCVLQLYRIDLESSLKGADLIAMSVQLLKNQVISQEIYDDFLALDHDNLEHDIQVRYLLQQICKRIQDDELIYYRLGEILHGLGGCVSRVYEAMTKELDRVLQEGERWGPEFSSMVSDCTIGKDSSAFVEVKSHAMITDPLSPASKRPRLCSSTHISNQSCDSRVVEEKSTLVEVQVGSNLCECYQWYKNGQLLLDGVDFSGVSSNILYIRKASKSVEGKYFCHVLTDSEAICSNDIQLLVVCPPEKELLIKQYFLTESRMHNDLMLSVGNYIPITLLHIIPGDPVARMVTEEKIEYKDVFGEYKEKTVINIEGPSGCGKSTLVHRVMRNWASGASILQGANLVFLVNLKLLSYSSKDGTVNDLLSVWYKDEYSRASVERELRKNGGKGACFILEDLDVYARRFEDDSIITQLIEKKCLPMSMVIVTARFPHSPQDIESPHTCCIKIPKLSDDQIYANIDTYPFSNNSSDMASKLKTFLNTHPDIFEMCRLPADAVMICYLFDKMQENIPQQKVLLYEKLVITTLLRQTSHYEGRKHLESLSDLRGGEKIKFNSLCKLAFDMTTHDRKAVSRSDSGFSFNDDSILGLLNKEHACRYYCERDLYSFKHVSFQEFLTAYYVSQLDEKNQKLLKESGAFEKGWLFNVWKLCFGMVGFEKSKDLIRAAFGRYAYEDSDDHYPIQCAFESRQTEFCDHVLGNDDSLSFIMKEFTFSDFLAIGYVISKASRPITKLTFSNCIWNKAACLGVSAFSLMADKSRFSFIKFLEIFNFYDCSDKFKAFNCLLGQLPALEELHLTDNIFHASSLKCLTRNITLTKLQTLKVNIALPSISYPEEILKLLTFGSQNLKKVYFTVYQDQDSIDYALWKKLLRHAFGFQVFQTRDISWVHLYNSDMHSSLVQERLFWCSTVVLVNCCIDDEQIQVLTSTLNSSKLVNLVLDFNRISDPGMVALSYFIAKCSTIREISVQCNLIGDSGATELAAALIHCNDLKKLDLQGNTLSDEGAVAVAKALKEFPDIDLYLHNSNITDEGIENVSMHRPRTNIRSMTFGSSWDGICDAGLDALRSALYGKTTPALKLSKANINELKSLTEELEQLKNVTALQCTSLENETIPTLCEIITTLKSLLSLECHEVGTIGSTYDQLLCETLNTCKNLQALALHASHSNVYSMIFLHSMVWSNLQSLDLQGTEKMGPQKMSKLFCNPTAWVNLHTLILYGKFIGSNGAVAVGEVLPFCLNLRVLNLSTNYIDDDGALALAKGLRNHVNLKELRLEDNSITSKGICALLPVVKQNSLQYLDISSCDLGSLGLTGLLDVMQRDALQMLNLSGNKLTFNDMATLSRALKDCTQLFKLYIRYNSIGTHGLAYLAEGLQHCKNLQVLDVGSNKITSDGIPSLLNIMEHCRYLRKLDLEKNSISMKDAVVLVSKWKRKSLLTLNLCHCSDEDSDHLLELYHSNDYIDIEYIGISRPPKLVSAEHL